MDFLHFIKAIIILDSDGKRIYSKYYSEDLSAPATRLAFEKNLFTKTHKTTAKTDAEIILLDNMTVIYRFDSDVMFYVVGGADENEAVLASVLSTLYETINTLARNQIDKRTLIENFDVLVLTVDEIVDEGVILELDSQAIVSRVSLQSSEMDTVAVEKKLSQTAASLKDSFVRSFLR
eukprot:TRINITY_DN3268_c0_g1_i1.p1 TRINITY_DN3268_c0_g1~~TRINITY_DN3268_c0_g1_i1.p1  ORF type:complete len:178 (+),score=22.26 TRINITY_DN3268_c0_g1_i1:77-610(+)